MAEIIANNTGRRKNIAPRVDLTPMVDLGFLLITFFMFTTVLTKPNTMEINMPDNTPSNAKTAFIDIATITLIPVNDNKIAFFHGVLQREADIELIDAVELRKLLTTKQSDLGQLPNTVSEEAHKLHVIIKPSDVSKYSDLVNILDEMKINAVPYYALADITKQESDLVNLILNKRK